MGKKSWNDDLEGALAHGSEWDRVYVEECMSCGWNGGGETLDGYLVSGRLPFHNVKDRRVICEVCYSTSCGNLTGDTTVLRALAGCTNLILAELRRRK